MSGEKFVPAMIWLGGTRPPDPMRMGAGKGLPELTTSIVFVSLLAAICVVLRTVRSGTLLPSILIFGRFSCTCPLTRTDAPTVILSPFTPRSLDPVKTKIPSEVRRSLSGSGSCR